MRMINHAMTGALIGLTVGRPVIALPAAFISHFVCDVIPHHGSQVADNRILRTTLFRNVLYADTGLSVLLALVLALRQPEHWFWAVVCAFLATAPDMLYINRYRRARQHKSWKASRLVQLMIDIQWFQRPIGALVEVVWFAGALTLLRLFLV